MSGEFRGRQGLADYFARNVDTVETLDFGIRNFLEGDDQVAIVGRETLRIKLTGEVADWVMLCTFRDEKISEILVIENLVDLANAYRMQELRSK